MGILEVIGIAAFMAVFVISIVGFGLWMHSLGRHKEIERRMSE